MPIRRRTSVPSIPRHRRRTGRRPSRAFLAVLATVLLVPAGSGSAQAVYYDGGMDTPSFNFRAVNLNSVWIGYADTTRGYWNSSGAGPPSD